MRGQGPGQGCHHPYAEEISLFGKTSCDKGDKDDRLGMNESDTGQTKYRSREIKAFSSIYQCQFKTSPRTVLSFPYVSKFLFPALLFVSLVPTFHLCSAVVCSETNMMYSQNTRIKAQDSTSQHNSFSLFWAIVVFF